MSLVHAILGFLHYGPMTGYDLKTECFDDSVSHFWPADQAQIYRTLDKLTEQGYAESRVEIQQDRPNRKVYTITKAGRAELARWLTTFQPLPVFREPFLIQLFFAAQLSNQTIIGLLEQQRQAHQELLTRYRQIEIPMLDDLGFGRDTRLQGLTLDLGFRVEQAYIDWIDASIQVVKQLAEPASPDGSGHPQPSRKQKQHD